MAFHIVDTYLTCRALMPKWQTQPDTESVFMKFLAVLLPQIDKRTTDELDAAVDLETSHCTNASPVHTNCAQVPIGNKTVQSGENAGLKYSIQGRCTMCQEHGRTGGEKGNRAPKTVWQCRVHPDIKTCKQGSRTCWQEHLNAVRDGGSGSS